MKSIRSRRRAGWALTLAAIAATVWLAPATAQATTAPPYTTSRYMQNVSTTRHYDLGCMLGAKARSLSGAQTDLAILHYFKPVRFADGSYGAGLLGGASAKTSAIGAAVREFAKGYFMCTGTDTGSRLTIGIGTSNDGSGVTNAHGRAWASMVKSINDWLATTGYDAQTHAVGASDLELGWNSPTATRAWVDGFSSVCCPSFYNYGDAAGCRYDGRQAGDECGTSSYPAWTAKDVWYVSYGAPPAFAVPQIYRTDGVMAKQWYGVSLYAKNVQGVSMWIQGSLTQSAACKEVGCSASTANTPSQGWTQLWNALNCKYFITPTCPTAQPQLTYSTDMSWTD